MLQQPNMASPMSSGLLRFSIRHLLVWTAVIALGCVALRSASPGWVAAMLGLSLFVLSLAVLLAVFRQGADRAHWIGFAAFGWLYVLLLMFGWSSDPSAYDNPFRPYRLATAQLSAWCYDRIYVQETVQSALGIGVPDGGAVLLGGAMGSESMGMSDGSGAMYGSGGMMPGGGGSAFGAMSSMPGGASPPAFTGPSQEQFVNVAHSLWALLLAACGGWLARWIYATGPAAKRAAADRADERR